MPGICGLIRPYDAIRAESDGPLFNAMLSSLAYGRCRTMVRFGIPPGYLGCVHLDKPAQSATYASGQAVALFHGYMAQPLGFSSGPSRPRASGARIVHDLYLAHGDDFVHHLEGAFAIAIWDKRQDKLVLCNDRLGLRPIYYAQNSHGLLFASEVKALLPDKSLPRQLNRTAVASFFLLGYILGKDTFFETVQLLPPGSLFTWQDDATAIRTYWSLTYPQNPAEVDDKAAEELVYNAMQDAVVRMLHPGPRYGVMLSGGIDSRWLAALLAREYPDAIAFTFGSDNADDMRIAAQVAAALGIEHIRRPLPPDYLAYQASDIVYISDGMYNIVHAHEFPLISSLNGEVDVLTGGFLGDLLFGRNIHPLTARLRTSQAAIAYTHKDLRRESFSDTDLVDLFGEREAQEMQRLARCALEESFSDLENPLDLRDHQNIMHRHRRFYYLAQLLKTPYIEMYHPFHDLAVIQTGLSLPIRQRYMQRAYLWALSNYFPELARIRWTLTSLPPTASPVTVLVQRALSRGVGRRLPDSFTENLSLLRVQRRSTNYKEWFRGPLRDFLLDVLLDDATAPCGLFRERGVAKLVDEHLTGQRDLTNGLGLLLTFKLWGRQFLEGPTPSSSPSLV